jgi:hypothetical protein
MYRTTSTRQTTSPAIKLQQTEDSSLLVRIRFLSLPNRSNLEHGCQIFLGSTHQNGKKHENNIKYTKWPQNIQNGPIYQYFPLQDTPKFTQIVILGLKKSRTKKPVVT